MRVSEEVGNRKEYVTTTAHCKGKQLFLEHRKHQTSQLSALLARGLGSAKRGRQKTQRTKQRAARPCCRVTFDKTDKGVQRSVSWDVQTEIYDGGSASASVSFQKPRSTQDSSVTRGPDDLTNEWVLYRSHARYRNDRIQRPGAAHASRHEREKGSHSRSDHAETSISPARLANETTPREGMIQKRKQQLAEQQQAGHVLQMPRPCISWGQRRRKQTPGNTGSFDTLVGLAPKNPAVRLHARESIKVSLMWDKGKATPGARLAGHGVNSSSLIECV